MVKDRPISDKKAVLTTYRDRKTGRQTRRHTLKR
jgi:hypothetical protein